MTGFRPFLTLPPAIEYIAVAGDTGGELVRFSWRSLPGGVITEHVHRIRSPSHQEGRFIVLAVRTTSPRAATSGWPAGDTVIVPAGVPHSEGSPGDMP